MATRKAKAVTTKGMRVVEVITHAEARPEFRYELQEQAPAGNWVTSLGTNDFESAQSHAHFIADKTGRSVRIVDRHS